MRLILTCVVAAILASCASTAPTHAPDDTVVEHRVLPEAYARALEDARVPEVDERQTSLTAISAANHTLAQRDFSGEHYVLMVTWTSWSGYSEHVGGEQKLSREVWVTPATEVADFCRSQNLEGDALVRRLEQRLGLPPDDGKTTFVELWVRPADLFRPCPDPEVDDTACELEFPTDPAPSPEHIAWIEHLRATSYGADGYPWTQLGYTFDWGSDSEVGPSEFVISKGATVLVEDVAATAAYCAPIGPSK